MPADADLIRRYLLGGATDSEAETLEHGYLASDEMIEAIADEEESLVGDYLAGRLAPGERRQFESRYMQSPAHSVRVAVIRGLVERAPRAQEPRPAELYPTVRRRAWRVTVLPLAAALLVTALLGVFWYQRSARQAGEIVSVVLPALHLRAEGETPTAQKSPGVKTIELKFEDGGVPARPPYEAAVVTIDGAVLWRGAATPITSLPDATPRLIASAKIPAAHIPAGDYLVVLISRARPEPQELQRYFLRVR